MAKIDPNGEVDDGSDDEHLVLSDEEGEEAVMEIEEIENEPKDSTKVKRCSVCRRMVFGHKGPVGKNKCKIEKIEDDEELKKDDDIKNEMRKKKKRDSSQSKSQG